MHSLRLRSAFTLVELLMVLVLLSMMGGMIVAAIQGVTHTARESRTKSIISAIDSVLLEQYETYKYRPFPVEIPDTFNPANFTTTGPGPTASVEIGFEVLSSEAARVRLMMVRDMQRMEMPDRLSDIAAAPQPLLAAANPVLQDSNDQILNTRSNRAQRRMFNVTWYDPNATYASGRDNIPSKLAAYRDRIPSGFNFNDPKSLENQGAECLYLIMATSFVGGSPAIDAIPATNIADTDEDGLPEILDGWGQPLGFIRWPVGYFDLELSINTSVPDDFDLFRSDYAFLFDEDTAIAALPTDVNANVYSPPGKTRPYTWSMRPLVFSYGPDGNPGIATNPWRANGTEQADFNYQHSNWRWPINNSYFGAELPGRNRVPGNNNTSTNPLAFPDPYLRRFVSAHSGPGGFTGVLPGQVLTSTTAATDLTDNITNYQLQATPR